MLNALKKSGFISLVFLSGVIASYDAMGAEVKTSSEKNSPPRRTQKNTTPPQRRTQPATSSQSKEAQATASLGQKIIRINTFIQSSNLDTKQKQFARATFDEFLKTPKGIEIMKKVPASINLAFLPLIESDGTYKNNALTLNQYLFDQMNGVKTDEDMQSVRLKFVGAFAAGLTAAGQSVQGLNENKGNTPTEKVLITRLGNIQETLNAVIAQDQASALPSYTPMNLNKMKETLPQLAFFKEMKDASDNQTAAAAFVNTYWTMKTDAVSLNGKEIKPSEKDMLDYSNSLQTFVTRMGRPSAISEKTTSEFDNVINTIVGQMGIKIPSSFFKDAAQASFSITSDDVTVYFDGKKKTEINFLTAGDLINEYREGGSLRRVILAPKREPLSGNFTDTFAGTKTARFSYTMTNGKIEGKLKGFDKSGKQTLEIPMKAGKPHGDGFIIRENGETMETRFTNGYARSVPYVNGVNGKRKMNFRE